jgi:hypothetical protein
MHIDTRLHICRRPDGWVTYDLCSAVYTYLLHEKEFQNRVAIERNVAK